MVGPLDRTSTVETGNSSLDVTVRDVVKQITTLLGQFGDCLRQDSMGLELTVEAYQGAEAVAVDAMGQINDDLNPAGRPIDADPGSTS